MAYHCIWHSIAIMKLLWMHGADVRKLTLTQMENKTPFNIALMTTDIRDRNRDKLILALYAAGTDEESVQLSFGKYRRSHQLRYRSYDHDDIYKQYEQTKMNRLAVYSYLTRYTNRHAVAGIPFTEPLLE